MSCVTTNSQATPEWSADQVFHLREWGTQRTHVLPSPSTSQCSIGAAPSCTVQLADASVSDLHAHLRRDARQWLIRALDRDQGLLQDGARCDTFVLEPGVEIGIGGLTLVAESRRSVALRDFCARLLGWEADRASIVDRALRAIRMARTHRTGLWLSGQGDLVPIAHSLHRHAFGVDRPFVVCDWRRQAGKASARSAANCTVGTAAVQDAAGGSVCVRSSRLPQDFSSVLALIRDPDAKAQLIVCSSDPDLGAALLAVPIEVPPLRERPADLPRIIAEYALDAITALEVPSDSFTDKQRDWILEHAATSLPEIEKATLRLVALGTSPNLSRAAARLRMAPVSLSRWIGRRRMPTRLRHAHGSSR
jgi:hypothetical protein